MTDAIRTSQSEQKISYVFYEQKNIDKYGVALERVTNCRVFKVIFIKMRKTLNN